ncbi:hypothetical protein ACLOJK_026851 [Asimina triloba]
MAQSLHFLTPPLTSSPRTIHKNQNPNPSFFQFHPNRTRISLTRRQISAFDSSSAPILASDNGKGAVAAPVVAADAGAIEVDAVTEAELKENGFRSTRRTKLVCTIGPATCGFQQLEALAVGGMNVARLNMCHGTREWHRQVISSVRRLNEEKGFAVAIMMDTEGSEIHMGDLGGAASAKAELDPTSLTMIKCITSPQSPYPTFNPERQLYQVFLEAQSLPKFVNEFIHEDERVSKTKESLQEAPYEEEIQNSLDNICKASLDEDFKHMKHLKRIKEKRRIKATKL